MNIEVTKPLVCLDHHQRLLSTDKEHDPTGILDLMLTLFGPDDSDVRSMLNHLRRREMTSKKESNGSLTFVADNHNIYMKNGFIDHNLNGRTKLIDCISQLQLKYNLQYVVRIANDHHLSWISFFIPILEDTYLIACQEFRFYRKEQEWLMWFSPYVLRDNIESFSKQLNKYVSSIHEEQLKRLKYFQVVLQDYLIDDLVSMILKSLFVDIYFH